MADQNLDQLYAAYQAQPTQENLTRVVNGLRPTVDFGLAQMNAAQDPLLKAKAAVVTASAVEKFDPAFGASLPTFLSSQLRQLTRVARQSRSPVKIPDRIQIESMKLNQARKSFFDEHGREPDTLELADFTGVPVKRIAKIRKYQVAIPAEQAVGDLEAETPDHALEAMDYVYHDSDHVDRRIMELKLGFANHPVMTPQQVAVALNLSPTQLSRRSARLAMRINKIEGALRS